jgi:hypothetical protein
VKDFLVASSSLLWLDPDDLPEELLFYFFFLVSWGGARLSPLGTSGTNWPIVPAPDDKMKMSVISRWNENWQRKPKYSEKTCPVPLGHHKSGSQRVTA